MGCMSIIHKKNMLAITVVWVSDWQEMGFEILSEDFRIRPTCFRHCVFSSVAPFISSGINRFPLKTKNGGKLLPIAFAHAITVTVVDLGEVTACGLLFGGAITFGLCGRAAVQSRQDCISNGVYLSSCIFQGSLQGLYSIGIQPQELYLWLGYSRDA